MLLDSSEPQGGRTGTKLEILIPFRVIHVAECSTDDDGPHIARET